MGTLLTVDGQRYRIEIYIVIEWLIGGLVFTRFRTIAAAQPVVSNKVTIECSSGEPYLVRYTRGQLV